MKNITNNKIAGIALLVIGILLIIYPFLGCVGTENDFQCRMVTLMFSATTTKITIGLLFIIGGIVALIAKQKKVLNTTFVITGVLTLLVLISSFTSYDRKITSCSNSSSVETVMNQGMQISTEINGKKLNITAGPCYERTYSWDNGTCTILQQARSERWYGSLGIYSPSSDDWKAGSCNTLNHAVVEEGQQHFNNMAEASVWMDKLDKSKTVYTNNGLFVSWALSPLEDKQFLSAEVWQIYINNTKPTKLEGAQDEKIKVVKGVQ
jgi:hypothetical protein